MLLFYVIKIPLQPGQKPLSLWQRLGHSIKYTPILTRSAVTRWLLRKLWVPYSLCPRRVDWPEWFHYQLEQLKKLLSSRR